MADDERDELRVGRDPLQERQLDFQRMLARVGRDARTELGQAGDRADLDLELAERGREPRHPRPRQPLDRHAVGGAHEHDALDPGRMGSEPRERGGRDRPGVDVARMRDDQHLRARTGDLRRGREQGVDDPRELATLPGIETARDRGWTNGDFHDRHSMVTESTFGKDADGWDREEIARLFDDGAAIARSGAVSAGRAVRFDVERHEQERGDDDPADGHDLACCNVRSGAHDASRVHVSHALDLLEPNNLRSVFAAYNITRDVAADLRDDRSFVRALWRSFGPARHRVPRRPVPVFAAPRPFAVPALAGQRIAVVASGGSGATAALVGVRRAFEEAGLEPAIISACSGSVLFASLWACGLSAEEIARFWLEIPASDYIDPDWRALARGALHRFRSTTGIMRGEAIERTFRRRLGGRTLGETQIPFAAVVWNIDANRVEYLSTRHTPNLEVAHVARIAISIPIMVEPVQIGSAWYADGGIVDIFPTTPLADEAPIDLVIGTNSYLPENFSGMPIGDWYHAPWSILRASGQLRYAIYLELAREHVRQLGDRLELLHPVSHSEVRGAQFYESFLDRGDWPRYMRDGHAAAREALQRRDSRIPIAARPLLHRSA